jgi:hypothetical protein
MAPIKITGHATRRVTPTRITISSGIHNRLMNVTTIYLAALSGIPARAKIGRNP